MRDALGDSFEQYDAPLVIKRDNGPAFRAAATKELLAAWPVFSLFSPPDCTSYNGGCERANQTMRRMTPHMAERANQGDWWRVRTFMRRASWRTACRPSDAWTRSGRAPSDTKVRVAGRTTKRVARNSETTRADSGGAGIDLDVSLPHYAQAESDRDAASPVLAELGCYEVKRRRYTPAI